MDWSSDVCSSDLGGADGVLLGTGAPAHGRSRGVGRPAGRHQLLGDATDAGHAHEDHDRASDGGDRPPVDGALLPHRGVLVRSEEHTSELQSLMRISYAVFCLKKKITYNTYLLKLNLISTNNTTNTLNY